MINTHCLVEALEGAGIVMAGLAVLFLTVLALVKIAEAGYEKLAATLGLTFFVACMTVLIYLDCLNRMAK